MKKLLIILLSALSLTAFAQQKKVAVYVTGDNAGVNKVLGSKLVQAIGFSGEFSAVERTASILAEINKEQSYQHSGEVDDDELSRLGKQFGVQYVCAAIISRIFNEDYISIRLIDVESAQVERTASSNKNIQSYEDLAYTAKTISDELFSSISNAKQSNSKKVAVYVIKNEASRNIGRVLGDKLVAGFTNSGRYIAVERTNGFLSQIKKEQKYQHEGSVDDQEIARIGKQFGVQYVCVAEVSDVYGNKHIDARLVDVETAAIENSYDAGGQISCMNDCIQLTNQIAENLSKGTYKEQKEEARLEAIRREQEKQRQRQLEEDRKKAEEARIRAEREKGFTETAFGINMKMAWVEGGDFLMGCTSEQSDCGFDEKNVRRVKVDDFYIGMLEVTQSQWEKVMGTNPSNFKGYNLPVEKVNWNDAMEFCRRLSRQTGKTYTLPTEAQWEYAAREGKKADGIKYAGSNMIDAVAWYWNNSGNRTHPCGAKLANALGIYDMYGNVWEWCKDWYSNSYMSSATNNPTGPSTGSDRVLRGGSWYNNATSCHFARRNHSWPDYRVNYIGFRVVCIP